MNKIKRLYFSIIILLLALVTNTYAFIVNNNVDINGIKVRIDNTYSSGIVFDDGLEVKSLNANLTNMKPVYLKTYNFYLNQDDEECLLGNDLFENVVYENAKPIK